MHRLQEAFDVRNKKFYNIEKIRGLKRK